MLCVLISTVSSFLLGGMPNYHKAYVNFIARFRKGELGETVLDQLPQTDDLKTYLP